MLVAGLGITVEWFFPAPMLLALLSRDTSTGKKRVILIAGRIASWIVWITSLGLVRNAAAPSSTRAAASSASFAVTPSALRLALKSADVSCETSALFLCPVCLAVVTTSRMATRIPGFLASLYQVPGLYTEPIHSRRDDNGEENPRRLWL